MFWYAVKKFSVLSIELSRLAVHSPITSGSPFVAVLQVLVAKSRSGAYYLQEESNLGFDSPVQKSENALNDESEAKIMFDTKMRIFIYIKYKSS